MQYLIYVDFKQMSGIQAPPNTPDVSASDHPNDPPQIDLSEIALQKHIEKTIQTWVETGLKVVASK
jgi:hypothetical protein